MPVEFNSAARTWTLSGGNTSYVLYRDEEDRLLNLYWGQRIPADALSFDPADYRSFASFDLPVSVLPLELPVCGSGWYGVPAVGIRDKCGDEVVDLRIRSAESFPGKPALPGLPATYTEKDEEADSLLILLSDAVSGLNVSALYTVFSESGVVTRSLLLENAGSEPVTVTSLLSASVPLWRGDLDAVHLNGAWARERRVLRTPVGPGDFRISSARGASGHEENPFLALCERNADEFSGSVWSVSLVYSGSFQAFCHTDIFGHPRLSVGMNPEVFSWYLTPGEKLSSPEAVLVYSGDGFNGMSHKYHALYRNRLARGFWRDRPRPVLLNSWESAYFDFDENRLLEIAGKAADIGAELFVVDDGWFGRRISDNSSLGDWVENPERFPSGLFHLSEKLHAMGLQFGLWFEPEMVSPDSDLYRAHPDWCLHVQDRPRTQGRQQLILDLSRPEVQEYIISAVSSVLSSAGVDYVKWDMNRNMTEAFSSVLPPERKKESQHRYMLGLYHVLESITSAFPNILFESCSGGGGRFDPGMLFYMPQTWTSDDTDAVERLKLQYGTSFVYPASSMGAHVSAVPNHQTGRTVPLKMRGDVALGGNFGFELDPGKLLPEELEEAKQMVARVKSLRDLTRQGTFWRLLSPFEGQLAAWAFVSENRKDILLCAYSVLSVPNSAPVRVRLQGLEPEYRYKAEDGRLYSGAALMYQGITLPLDRDFSSIVLLLKAV
jgi:alpha-galactosidase